jgi:hypothetical protein
MSWEDANKGFPLDGEKMFFKAGIKSLASVMTSYDGGTCTAIWSPSKSTLKAPHASGCNRMALLSIGSGSNA